LTDEAEAHDRDDGTDLRVTKSERMKCNACRRDKCGLGDIDARGDGYDKVPRYGDDVRMYRVTGARARHELPRRQARVPSRIQNTTGKAIAELE
jgi:hypothetical protein